MNPANPNTANDVSPAYRPTALAPEQMRAARGLLGWSRNELAQKAGTSAETIKNIEHGVYSPKKETLAAIVETFLSNGIQFVHYETLVTVPTGNRKTLPRFARFCVNPSRTYVSGITRTTPLSLARGSATRRRRR